LFNHTIDISPSLLDEATSLVFVAIEQLNQFWLIGVPLLR
jgi:hypothetical protein